MSFVSQLPLVVRGQPPVALYQDESQRLQVKVLPAELSLLDQRFHSHIQMIHKARQAFDAALISIGEQNLAVWRRLSDQLSNQEDLITRLNDPSYNYGRITANVVEIAKAPVEILLYVAKTRLEIIRDIIDLWREAEDYLEEKTKHNMELYIEKASKELDLEAKKIANQHQGNMNGLIESAEALKQQAEKESMEMKKLQRRIELQEKEKQNAHRRDMEARKVQLDSEYKDKVLKAKTLEEKRKLLAEKQKEISELEKLKINLKHNSSMENKKLIGKGLDGVFGIAEKLTSVFSIFTPS